MGHPDNITESTLKHLSEHWDKTLDETKLIILKALETNDPMLNEDQHIKDMFEKAAQAWGQSVDEAKKNTLFLLKKEVK